MKIRIKDNAVRFRLTQSEVATFGKEGYLASHTEFNGNTFTYALKASGAVKELQADFSEQTITLYLPIEEKELWPGSDRVGYEARQLLNNGRTLHLLLEKDFVCLDETMEDQTDNYPNPRADKGHS